MSGRHFANFWLTIFGIAYNKTQWMFITGQSKISSGKCNIGIIRKSRGGKLNECHCCSKI